MVAYFIHSKVCPYLQYILDALNFCVLSAKKYFQWQSGSCRFEVYSITDSSRYVPYFLKSCSMNLKIKNSIKCILGYMGGKGRGGSEVGLLCSHYHSGLSSCYSYRVHTLRMACLMLKGAILYIYKSKK